MADFDNQNPVFVVSLITILGGLAFFQAGVLFSGNLDQGVESQTVMSQEKVSDKVKNYVSVTSGERANASVRSIERSDKIESFYRVDVELTAEVLNQTRTQETSVFVSRDGAYIMSGEPKDLDNPQPPQQRTAPSRPNTGEEENMNQTQ